MSGTTETRIVEAVVGMMVEACAVPPSSDLRVEGLHLGWGGLGLLVGVGVLPHAMLEVGGGEG